MVAGLSPRPFRSRPRCELLHASRFGCEATEFSVVAQVPIRATAIGILAGNCTSDCLDHRNVGPFPAIRATLGAECGHSGKGIATLSRRRAGRPASDPARTSVAVRRPTVCRRCATGGQPASERSHKRTSRVWAAGLQRRPARGDACRFHPVAKEASTEADGPKPVPVAPRMRASACLSIRPRGNGVQRSCTSSNKRDRYWNSGGKLHIRLPRSSKHGTLPGHPRKPWCGVRSLRQGKRAPVKSSSGTPSFGSRSNIGSCEEADRVPSMRGVRTACLRTQPQANKPSLGSGVPRRPARGDACRFHPVAEEASTEAGPGPSPLQSRPGCDLPHAS